MFTAKGGTPPCQFCGGPVTIRKIAYGSPRGRQLGTSAERGRFVENGWATTRECRFRPFPRTDGLVSRLCMCLAWVAQSTRLCSGCCGLGASTRRTDRGRSHVLRAAARQPRRTRDSVFEVDSRRV